MNIEKRLKVLTTEFFNIIVYLWLGIAPHGSYRMVSWQLTQCAVFDQQEPCIVQNGYFYNYNPMASSISFGNCRKKRHEAFQI